MHETVGLFESASKARVLEGQDRRTALVLALLAGLGLLAGSLTWSVHSERARSRRYLIELDQTNHQLAAENEAFRAALERSTLMLVLDHEGRTLSVNQPFVARTDHDPKQLLGHPPPKLRRLDDGGEDWSEMLQAIQPGCAFRAEFEGQTEARGTFFIDASFMPTRTGRGPRKADGGR